MTVLPTQACKIVQLWTEREMISFPLTHLIHVEIEKGKYFLAGFSFDIFASSENNGDEN
ncbi:hypothetical protein [Thermoactinomyces mirandus]|uniref:Uncharacterized protein n=1 Tax=Thermoactinomyces mirandus TaxID=2756294 RepID=A0A7W1XUI4_9BACL|nr:hypothetical protein [Thermoactinomyces mirandus]MBA4603539.1 hypothetical protein [Thermoactinomyces mirandus]